MKMSPAGRKVLADREGRRRSAYRDSVGVWTIGIGHTSAAGPPRVTPGLTITEAECDAIFARDLRQYETGVAKAVRVPMTQHEFDALVSFCYNIGIGGLARSSAVRLLNAGEREKAGEALLLWNKPSVILSRRRGERAQFLGEGYVARLGEGERPTNVAMRVPTLPPKPIPKPAAFSWWRRLFGRAA